MQEESASLGQNGYLYLILLFLKKAMFFMKLIHLLFGVDVLLYASWENRGDIKLNYLFNFIFIYTYTTFI